MSDGSLTTGGRNMATGEFSKCPCKVAVMPVTVGGVTPATSAVPRLTTELSPLRHSRT